MGGFAPHALHATPLAIETLLGYFLASVACDLKRMCKRSTNMDWTCLPCARGAESQRARLQKLLF